MIELVKTDITTLRVDAIVNAANASLRGGGGVDGAIHRAAGPEMLKFLASKYPEGCMTGYAVATPGFNLFAKVVIHAVGPIWKGGMNNEADALASAYRDAFELAYRSKCKTIALPSISTGIYGYPKVEAAAIAAKAMRVNEMWFTKIIACVFDNESEQCMRLALEATR